MGLSLFGEALLDGLNGRGLPPDCSGGTCCIFLHRLRPFVGDKIKQIVLTRYNQTSSQRVRVPRGDQTEEPVTEVPTPQPRTNGRAGGDGGGPRPPAPPALEELTVGPGPAPRTPQPVLPTTANWQDVHEFFGSEQITDLWTNTARVFDYESMKWLEKGDDIKVAEARRSPDNTALQFKLSVPAATAGHTYWLQIQDSVQAQAFVFQWIVQQLLHSVSRWTFSSTHL